MKASRILIVDDEPAMLRSVERVLEQDHEVRSSVSPAAALEMVGGFRPDLAIVDIRMPEMDGFELMHALHSRDPEVRVILMTGSIYEVDEQLIRAIREKAFYFINKPFDREVLRTLVDRCLELRRLEEAGRRYTAHLEAQLAEAQAFQRTMIPPGQAEIEGFAIHAERLPCVELGGDLYDYAGAGPGRVALLVADVSGHGVSAAMLTAIVKSAFHRGRADGYEPLHVVHRVHEAIAAFRTDRFVTLICARISGAERRMEYVNAGHEGGLVGARGRRPEGLASTGPLVSPALPEARWERCERPWSPGARVLLYTDGLCEQARDGEVFGGEPLAACVASGDSPGAALARLVGDFKGFTRGRPWDDDVTAMIVG